MSIPARCVLAALVFSFSTTLNVYADPIRIISGTVSESASSIMDFAIAGDSLTLSGAGEASSNPLQQCIVCMPGSPYSLGSWYDFSGSAVLDSLMFSTSGRLTFEASSVLVPDLPLNQGATFTSPFTMTGSFADANGTPIGISGAGTATLRFFHHEGEPIGATFIGYRFTDTEPVPEPATMMLLGSGLAGVMLRVRRRRLDRADDC